MTGPIQGKAGLTLTEQGLVGSRGNKSPLAFAT